MAYNVPGVHDTPEPGDSRAERVSRRASERSERSVNARVRRLWPSSPVRSAYAPSAARSAPCRLRPRGSLKLGDAAAAGLNQHTFAGVRVGICAVAGGCSGMAPNVPGVHDTPEPRASAAEWVSAQRQASEASVA